MSRHQFFRDFSDHVDEFYEDDALTWKKGDMCYAPWSDGQLYMAQIIRMKKDQAYVAFIEYEGERAWVTLHELEPMEEHAHAAEQAETGATQAAPPAHVHSALDALPEERPVVLGDPRWRGGSGGADQEVGMRTPSPTMAALPTKTAALTPKNAPRTASRNVALKVSNFTLDGGVDMTVVPKRKDSLDDGSNGRPSLLDPAAPSAGVLAELQQGRGSPSTPSRDDLAQPSMRRAPSSTKKSITFMNKRERKRDELLAESARTAGKDNLSLVVIGHVDAGKSTLMGHLLVLCGEVDRQTMRYNERQSKVVGKGSFAFAWVLDQHEEERTRGITVDVAVSSFSTDTKQITLLDSPGHRDFIPNMISGASQADCAVLVVPAKKGEFESGFESSGQTKEHAILAKSLGVREIIVAVNKLDAVDWSQERYHVIVEQLKPFLRSAGFRDEYVRFVPVSGLDGINIVRSDDKPLPSLLSRWYNGPTLVEMIDSFTPPPRLVERPFRMCLTDVFRSQQLGVAVAGKIEAGSVMPKDKLLLMPAHEVVSVRGVERLAERVPIATAGESVELGLRDLNDEDNIAVGMYLCSLRDPIPLVSKVRAQILCLDIAVPILKGHQMVLFMQSVRVPAVVSRLIAQLDKASGEVIKRKPRCLKKGESALVTIKLERPICAELYSNFKQLGRFTLRRGNETTAVGIITLLARPDWTNEG